MGGLWARVETHPRRATHSLERWGWASIGINLLLSGLNLAMACASGSVAVAAEMVHNLVDLVASVAVLAGLKLSQRTSSTFPYGLYKVENLVAAGVAILIFVAAYEIVCDALFGSGQTTIVTPLILVGVASSALIPFVFGLFEMRAGRAANSPSLMADAQEYRVHVLTSGVVWLALIGNLVEIHIERFAALLVAVVVVKTGWDLLWNSMRVLLDASLDAGTLAQASKIIEQEPTFVAIRSLQGRNAGRHRFLEASVEVRVHELERADFIGRELERKLLEAIPFLERALVEVRPTHREINRTALPVESPEGPPCKRFGAAPYFVLADRRRSDGEIVRQQAVANPFSGAPSGRGLKVVDWLVGQQVDRLVCPDDISDRGPGHALREAGVEVVLTCADSVQEALEPPESSDAARQRADCGGSRHARSRARASGSGGEQG